MKRISLQRKFSSIEELLSSEDFLPYLEKEVNSVTSKRINRAEPPAGMHYKRTTIDQMMEDSELNINFMLEYYPHIHHKISSMPSARRGVVSYICGNAIDKFMDETTVYLEENSKLNVKDSKAKLKILSIDDKKNQVKIEFLKKRENWDIGEIVQKIENGTLWK